METLAEAPSGGKDPAAMLEEREMKDLVPTSVEALPEDERTMATIKRLVEREPTLVKCSYQYRTPSILPCGRTRWQRWRFC